jgi:hypothetical protein
MRNFQMEHINENQVSIDETVVTPKQSIEVILIVKVIYIFSSK